MIENRCAKDTTVSDSQSKTGAPLTHVTLAVVLQVRDGRALRAALAARPRALRGAWSLPGGYLGAGDTLDDSIRAQLARKVDVAELSWLEQLETLSDPGRHPAEWQLATAYLGLVPLGLDPALPDDTAWHPVERLPERWPSTTRRSCWPAASACARSSPTPTSASRWRPRRSRSPS